MLAVNTPIKVFLIDDHRLFRAGLAQLLENTGEFEVCANVGSAAEALKVLAEGLEFDAALIDYELNGPSGRCESGLDLAASIRALRPEANLLMVTAGMRSSELFQAIHELKIGIFLKSDCEEDLLRAVTRTAQGEMWLSTQTALLLVQQRAAAPPEQTVPEPLTSREQAVLQGILEGLSNKEIGAKLDATEGAIKATLQRLFEKVGVRSRSQLVRYAIEMRNEERIS
jgi:DNA-binding NarL/FixJ family response regulator